MDPFKLPAHTCYASLGGFNVFPRYIKGYCTIRPAMSAVIQSGGVGDLSGRGEEMNKRAVFSEGTKIKQPPQQVFPAAGLNEQARRKAPAKKDGGTRPRNFAPIQKRSQQTK